MPANRVCKRARASRNKKVRGREYYGYCVAKKEKFFGFRLHLIVDPDGLPVSLAILPAAYHDLTPLYEITSPLPQDTTVIGDKAYNCQLVESGLAELGDFFDAQTTQEYETTVVAVPRTVHPFQATPNRNLV